MVRSWHRLTEQRIRKAEREGKLSGLEGEGRPLPDRSGEAGIDAGTLVGHRMMAEAGALPEEFRLKRALDEARAAWRAETDPEERKRRMAEIADLELKYHIAVEARKAFLR